MPDEKSSPEHKPFSDETIYQETAKVAAIFWEWRDKTMNRFVAGIAGVIAAMVWLYEPDRVIRKWHAVPLLIGAVYSVFTYLLDKRIRIIFVECYDIAAKIELKGRDNGGIYKFIRDRKKGDSLTQLLRIMYLTCAILLFALSVAIFVAGI